MEQESLSPIDQVRGGLVKGREALELLNSTHEFVFHGTGVEVEKLEPRQAHNYTPEGKKADHIPVVFATDNVDTAIFMALYGAAEGSKSGRFQFRDGKMTFGVSPGVFDNAELKGKVYVLPKDEFQHLRGVEYVSEKEVRPVLTVEVKLAELPTDIEVIPLWKDPGKDK